MGRRVRLWPSVIDAADMSRSLLTESEVDQALTATMVPTRKLMGTDASALAELSNPNRDPGKWCNSFFAVYIAATQLS